MAHRKGSLEEQLREKIEELVDEISIEELVPRIEERLVSEFGIVPQVHKIVRADGSVHLPEGIVHEAFGAIAHFIDNDIPVYLYGPTGSGKNYLCSQVAEALGLDFHYANSVTDEFKITGFIDAYGNYQETEFYRAFTQGGIFFLDEIDASAPEVLVCLNAAIENRYFAFPVGVEHAHENFRVVAAGNTIGSGANSEYTGRTRLDEASLNRFVLVPVDYDRQIDLLCASGDHELVKFARQYRQAVKMCGIRSSCSYRNLRMIKAAEATMGLSQAIVCCLARGLDEDDRNHIAGTHCFDADNRFFKAFCDIEDAV